MIVIRNTTDNSLTAVTDKAAKAHYAANDTTIYKYYRVSPNGDGTFLLTPVQKAAGSEVIEQRIVDFSFEDA